MAEPTKPPTAAPDGVARRAARYLRMSTDMQCYSLENQTEVIAAYADAQGFKIECSYVDAGRSGLTLRQRPALQALLADVEDGPAFSAVLVYDVSRWGRFQDPEEAAYYEYLCRRSGVEVIYCAEPFERDASPMTALLKALKRAMAAEFSRELSVKVSTAKRRLASLGYLQGGTAPFGLRRRLFDIDGRHICDLKPGEQKAVRAHRVSYVHGPALEVAIVQLVFWFYVEKRLSFLEIARRLNGTALDLRPTPWTANMVATMLGNALYVGDLVYGRHSTRLRTPKRPCPSSSWIRVAGAFEPIVDRAMFDQAQRIRFARSGKMSSQDMIVRLSVLLGVHGRLTARIINDDPDTPSARHYQNTFGSLEAAYWRAGRRPKGGEELTMDGSSGASAGRR